MSSFDELLRAAEANPIVGFDFSFLDGRVDHEPSTWDYLGMIRARLRWPLLDMGTGGGEIFAQLAPFDGLAVATEAWPPNVPVAAERLEAVGASVVQVQPAPDNHEWTGSGGALPFAVGSFALVINRHESYSPTEVSRVLRPGGEFVTQQVGPGNVGELRESFGSFSVEGLDLAGLRDQLEQAGMEVIEAREEFTAMTFRDVGAVAWYMDATSWDFPGFSFETSRPWLAEVDERIRRDGGLTVREHRQVIIARKPSGGRALTG